MGLKAYPPFNISSEHEIIRKTMIAFQNLGIESYITSTGGGSDTNIFNGNGIISINLDIGMKKSHTFDEHISIENLNKIPKIVLEIMKTF
ncbi:Di- and tripeptidase [Clostridium aceticum]|uniref:Di-and tripeptidase n=1 Tax=Clostridium aceticum TaxID=84022 RepID=A0A0D8IBB9_9CLOT|nr:hypothetical protein [Clostridium aceticum]AKL96479.1 Di- and tripeptidase [Clostridium aceticum]KJF27349.1 hypothetical protein TZ02_08410 [Clostridium aceticum]